MKLYIDESGNTGETLCANSKFNFSDQPYYVLAGILLNDLQQDSIESFISDLKTKFRIQSHELKAKNLYDSNPSFIEEIINYVVGNKIPFFIELMDKNYYIHMLLVEYFIAPYYSLPVTEDIVYRKRLTASHLEELLNTDIYENFIKTVKDNTNESLEKFYDILIAHFISIDFKEYGDNVLMTKEDYFELKKKDQEEALKRFLPIPDENPNCRLIHFLPNYGAFTNMIGRANLFQLTYSPNPDFEIIHDEQKQFDVIFQKALESMKNMDTDTLVENLLKRGTFNIAESLKLTFTDSKTNAYVQISDLIAGVVMRFWADFINENRDKIKTYLPLITKLNYSMQGSSVGINYVTPVLKHKELMRLMILNTSIDKL